MDDVVSKSGSGQLNHAKAPNHQRINDSHQHMAQLTGNQRNSQNERRPGFAAEDGE